MVVLYETVSKYSHRCMERFDRVIYMRTHNTAGDLEWGQNVSRLDVSRAGPRRTRARNGGPLLYGFGYGTV